MKSLCISTMKGGVGKSTTCHALGDTLSTSGLRVLLVDIDPQSTLTQACGITTEQQGIVDVIRERQPVENCIKELTPTLHILPSDIELATVELELSGVIGRESVLKRSLQHLSEQYDLCLIDTPPSLGLLTINALVSADSVLIPTQPQTIDLRGLQLFLQTLEKIRERLNPDLTTLGILVTMYDPRTIHHREAMTLLEQTDLPLMPVQIGRSIRVAESSALHESIVTYDPENPRAKEYVKLAEIIKTWQKNEQV